MLKPAAVPAGSRVALVAPASPARADRVEQGLAALRSLGYEPVPGAHAMSRSPQYFSGTAQERVADLHAAFRDAEIKAIFCTRGGYGSNYLLESLDLDLIRRNPKPFIAYSDMTAIQTWLLDQTGLVSFHGPMVAADFCNADGVHIASLQSALVGQTYSVGSEDGLRVLRSGTARGILYGGCMSLLVASLGTPCEAMQQGGILFFEDVSAKPYQVDRMLRQLILAGKLDGVQGIIFGEMLDCVSPGAGDRLLEDVILRVLETFEGPIAIGLRSGHVSRHNVTLCFGVEAYLDLPGVASSEARLQFLEAAVTS